MKQLRKYQQDAVNTIFSKLEQGVKSQILCLATGLGKTICAVNIAAKFKSTLFIVDSEELLEQAAFAFLREKFDDAFVSNVQKIGFLKYVKGDGLFALSDFKMGAIKADVFQPIGTVVIASAQTLHRRLHLLDPNMFDCLIIDECHVAMANTYQKGITFFTPQLRLGLTATPTRTDGVSLGDLFDEITYDYNIADGIKEGYLVELDAVRIKTNVNLDSVKSKGGDLNESQLSNEVNTLARNNLVCQSYIKYCNNQPAIGFACDIKHAMDLADTFIEQGIKASAVSSNEELTGDRSQKIKDFKVGRIQVLFNVGILVKGFDFDAVSCIIAARPTKSLTLYLQAIGRGTRTLTGVINGLETAHERIAAIKKSGKPITTIIDIVDNTSKHNLINTFELDKGKNTDDKLFLSSEKKQKIADEKARKAKLEHQRLEDEKVKLLQLPQIKFRKNIRSEIPATIPQLEKISRMGYNITDNHYTHGQIVDIINSQPATSAQLFRLKKLNYNCEGFVSFGVANVVLSEYFKTVNK